MSALHSDFHMELLAFLLPEEMYVHVFLQYIRDTLTLYSDSLIKLYSDGIPNIG